MTILADVEATLAHGARWAESCRGGEVFALNGELGSGKTQLVKGFTRAMEYAGEVTSPTYTLIHEYIGGRLPVYHLDLYRLETTVEALRLGLEDYLPADGVTFIEWPKLIAGLLPGNTVHVEIEIVSLRERAIRERLG
ncbi:MAG: tRNA (adenosine(37)-N6)-threonylcarbamoyltransferase complex ATPase subunit type 1 TsaE [Verrucomicrobiota bacterium]